MSFLCWIVITPLLQVQTIRYSNLDGFYPISLECYFNGHLSVLRRSQFGSAGKAPLYVGGSPSNTYHHYGRIYSVMVLLTVGILCRFPILSSLISRSLLCMQTILRTFERYRLCVKECI